MKTWMGLAFALVSLVTVRAFAQGYSTGLPIPGLPNTTGQMTSANSTSVVIASDQSPLPIAITGSFSITSPGVVSVTGTVSVSGTVSVTGAVSIVANANGSQETVTATAAESNYAAPSNAVGAIIESESGNSVNVRWGVSDSATPILSSTVGMLMEPGRDSGYLLIGQGTYVHLIGVSAGNEAVGIQWILSQ